MHDISIPDGDQEISILLLRHKTYPSFWRAATLRNGEKITVSLGLSGKSDGVLSAIMSSIIMEVIKKQAVKSMTVEEQWYNLCLTQDFTVTQIAIITVKKIKTDKQQKGEFSVDGYTVKLNNTLRKDGKKDCCFEVSAPDKRIYQFAAATPKEADEWVQEIDFVVKDLQCITIPEDTEEGEQYDDVGPSSNMTPPKRVPHQEIIEPGDDIYEELPEEESNVAVPEKKPAPPKQSQDTVSSTTPVNKSTDYANLYQGLWDCSGDYPDELSFKHGDTIYILNKDEYNKFGWWVGEMNGAIGLVPKEYITEMYDIWEAGFVPPTEQYEGSRAPFYKKIVQWTWRLNAVEAD